MEQSRPDSHEAAISSTDYASLLEDAQSYPAVDREHHLGGQAPHERVQGNNPESIRETEAHEQFASQLDTLGQSIPEIAQARERIDVAGRELIDRYSIKPELFQDPGRVLIFTALAERTSKPQATSNAEEAKFVQDALILLGQGYSDKLKALSDETKSDELKPSEAEQLRAYDRFTDRQLTAEIHDAVINKGLLDQVKIRLGITAENEDLYEIRVLSIGDETSLHGLAAPRYPDELPENRDERLQLMKELDADQASVRRYRDDLKQRSDDLARQLGEEHLFATAWMTKVEGKTLLCITAPLAEKLLDPSVTDNTTYYNDQDRAGDIAILEHEYTHTQGGLDVDHEPNFGINMEEVRAEYFSGNRQGYQDVKGLFADLAEISGKNITDDMEGKTKGGTIQDIYSSLANQVGLDSMLEVSLLPPRNYLTGQNTRQMVDAFDYLGGYDGVIGRILDKSPKDEAMQQRIDERARKILDVTKGDYEHILLMRRANGRNIVTDLIEARVNEIIQSK